MLFLFVLVLLPCVIIASDNESCSTDADVHISSFIKDGGFLVLILAVVVSLWALALVCEEYFVPSLQVLCRRWKVPDSVAGSLIMAAGNNAPELFVSFLGIFVQKSAIGIGTVFGSEIFNHMCISAGSGYFAKGGVLQLNKFQFTRDCFGYCVALVVFMCSVGAKFENTFRRTEWGNCLQVTLYASLALVGCQLLYCLLVAKFVEILNFLGIEEEEIRLTVRLTIGDVSTYRPTLTGYRASINDRLLREDKRQMADGENAEEEWDVDDIRMTNRDTITLYNELPEKELFSDKMLAGASTLWTWCVLPFKVMIEYTVPNVQDEKMEDYYVLAIFVCIVWLAVFAYALCECLTLLGEWLHIPAVIMGLTFSAVGTSFPNLWCSLVVAKNGQGDMAVSNALGSNTFNIFVALGLPWLCFTAINGQNYNKLQDSGIIYLSLMLITVLLIYYFAIMMHDWKIYAWMWKPMAVIYAAVIVICCTVTKK